MARRRRREGCSLRPLGCLALLFLCGLCTTSTFFGGRAAEERGWIPEVDAPVLPNMPHIEITVGEREVETTSEPTPSATPDRSSERENESMPVSYEEATDDQRNTVASIVAYQKHYRGIEGEGLLGYASFHMGKDGGGRVLFRDYRRDTEEWEVGKRSLFGRPRIERVVRDERGTSSWRWSGNGWRLN